MTERKEAVRGPGGLEWARCRVLLPVRFTHDAGGYRLLNQPGRRKSRPFEMVLRCDKTALSRPAFRPLSEGNREGGDE